MFETYMKSIKSLFQYYKMLGDRTFEQLNDEDLFFRYNDDSNSIGIIVNHLWGNMKSRWTDFLNSDGEKNWRNRDMEFEAVISTREELLSKWEDGWNTLFQAIDTIRPENFEQKVYIRNQEHTIPEAINRQLGHYAYHVGQIVYIGKMAKSNQWKSLSIPKGKSGEFNRKKFEKGKHGGDFTEDAGKI